MIELHKFHFKIDLGLLEEIDKYCKTYKFRSREMFINNIFSFMIPFLENIDNMDERETIKDESSCFNHELHIKLKPEIISRLKYFHFRFKTFSMATILRWVLRCYLILYKGAIIQIVKELRERQSKGLNYSRNFKVHMDQKINKKTRKLTMDNDYNLLNLTVLT